MGNGRLGAMVFGGPEEELLQLNDDTLYSGGPATRSFTPDLTARFDEVRAHLRAGRYAEAEKIVTSDWLGTTHTSYQPLGDWRMRFSLPGAVEDYRRELRLADGMAAISFRAGGIAYRREIFASHPDDVLVCQFTADRPAALHFTAGLSSVHPGTVFRVEDGLGIFSGRAPTLAMKRSLAQIQEMGDAWKYPELFDASGQPRPGVASVLYDGRGMPFAAVAKISVWDGEVMCGPEGWSVMGATRATLVLSTGTGFVDFRRPPEGDAEARPCAALRDAPEDYEILRQRHVADFRALFDRMDIQLGGEENSRPANLRREAFARGEDQAFAALQVHFARYLMISASRPGSEPINLQGIWNTEVVPPWNCGYTLNINTEMAYWLAEPANLAECHEPLLRLVREAAENGRRLARDMFGRAGWVCFHHIGIWRDVQPSDGRVCWAFWPMAQAWLVQHCWQHFEFSGDREFLREAYPLLRGAAEFLLDWLVEDDGAFLVTPAGTSPENMFGYAAQEGRETASLSPGPEMDIALTRECLAICRDASARLGIDDGFREKVENALCRLPSARIGAMGRLQEWRGDFVEEEPAHRHLSHLFGLHPGSQITRENNPKLIAAARSSLERRGDESTGWSTAWKACLWTRLGDGNRAWKLLRALWGPALSYPNLFCAHPPFQIDGNFGGPAALLEMLAQSRPGLIELLPALPDALPEGRVRGLRVRGGFVVSLGWSNSQITDLEVFSSIGGDCRIRWKNQFALFPTKAKEYRRLGEHFRWAGV